MAARAIKSGEAQLMIAGGVESMTRAPFVMGKAERLLAQRDLRHHHRLALRQSADEGAVRHRLHAGDGRKRGQDFGISRADQDAFALRSQQRWAAAQARRLRGEIAPLAIPQKKGDPLIVTTDEHPRPDTTLEMLAKLKGVVRPDGTVTAGNASGVNDGACALLLASPKPPTSIACAPRARAGHGHGRRGAAHHGLRPVAGGKVLAQPA
jgi:acetyl-CoA acetyltransferase